LETGGTLLDKGGSGDCFTELNALSVEVKDLKYPSSAMPQLTAVQRLQQKSLKTEVVLKTSRIIANRTRRGPRSKPLDLIFG
jgi:hypothetical protein